MWEVTAAHDQIYNIVIEEGQEKWHTRAFDVTMVMITTCPYQLAANHYLTMFGSDPHPVVLTIPGDLDNELS